MSIFFVDSASEPIYFGSLESMTLEDIRALAISVGHECGELFSEAGDRCFWLSSETEFQKFRESVGKEESSLLYFISGLQEWSEAPSPLFPGAHDIPLQTVLSKLHASGDASPSFSAFVQRLQGIALHTSCFRDNALRKKVLTSIPVARLVREALEEKPEEARTIDESQRAGVERSATPLGSSFRLHLLRKTMAWFRHHYFEWVSTPTCASCGKSTQGIGSCEPLPSERAVGGAAMVEIYKCSDTSCHMETRFPRYNLPSKLLDTRRGRCGEFANAFVSIVLAMGYRARHITDFSDHVWGEVWVDGLGWLHADPCEVALDRPLLYETGWGKSLTFIFAAGIGEFRDVTRRYTKKWGAVEARRVEKGVKEECLKNVVAALESCLRLRVGKPMTLSAGEDLERAREEAELVRASSVDDGVRKYEECLGRITGTEEWKRARGEMGKDTPPDSGGSGGGDIVKDGEE